ncbi:MAG TPA: DUF2272 domain-containing protein [Xanthobacteraceae bacterium]|nr:DUF2272 domain-containing protein [Xanthobacteraceae bacterium]
MTQSSGRGGGVPTRGVRALLGVALCVLASSAFAQEIDNQRFVALAKRCQATAAAPPSPAALAIRDVALSEYKTFQGSRVDHAGRIVLFGHAEAESDQESSAPVTPRQIPWREVLRFWEDLQGDAVESSPNPALEVWFYPGLTDRNPPPHVPRRRAKLETLLRAIDRMDFSSFGEDAAGVKAALQQSAIRASISDVAWSAAFISSVMRQAGLSSSAFAYSSSHIRYIVASIRQSLADLDAQEATHFYRACDPDLTRPRAGDLYCSHRHVEGTKDPYLPKPGMSLFRSLFRDLMQQPSVISRTHCDVVVRVDDAAKKVVVIGGNVQNSVTERTLNLNRKGVLSRAQGNLVAHGRSCARGQSGTSNEESGCRLNGQKWFVLLQART